MELYRKGFSSNSKDGFSKNHICSTQAFCWDMVELEPGQRLPKVVHRLKDEVVYVLEGKVDITIDDVQIIITPGNVLHIEPGEIHGLYNPYETPVKMILVSTQIDVPDCVIID